MSKKILLIHSSVDGHTVKILDKISSLIGEKRSVTKKCISEVSKDLIKQSDSIVIGASIRYGDHRKNLYEFVDQNKDLLDEKDNASIEVYTTRPDTIFGVTFLVLSPEHPIIEEFIESKDCELVF